MIVACVRTGTRYGVDYVHKLQAMVARHLPIAHRFVCLTDRPRELPGIGYDISGRHLAGWWGKMALFDFAGRSRSRVVYFDLDTVICGDLSPLAALDVEFAICANFTKAAGHPTWPCRYGSCVMSLAGGFGGDVFDRFMSAPVSYMARAGYYGDQKAIEELVPAATLLQDVMPPGYFLGYRDITHVRPKGAAIVVFAGRSKPHNTTEKWIGKEWTL